MHESPRLEIQSSWLVNRWVILSCLLFFVLSTLYQQPLLAAFFLFLFFICALAWAWSRYALNKIYPSQSLSQTRLFPGQSVVMRASLENRKFWPLIWLQWEQEFANNPVLVPENKAEWFSEAHEGEMPRFFFRKRLSWLLWYRTQHWQSGWKAERRGVVTLPAVQLSSGDGFGLAAVKKQVNLPDLLQIVVYPALIDVDASLILTQVLGMGTDRGGLMEEVTLLKSTRAYQPGDPWKRINWRLAARQQPLQINLYEKVSFQPVRFILDARSFLASDGKEKDFEDALSILASIMVILSEQDIAVALTLPQSGQFPAVRTAPDSGDHHVMTLLERLAYLDLQACGDVFEAAQENGRNGPTALEQVYWVTFDAAKWLQRQQNLRITPNLSWMILSYRPFTTDNSDEDKRPLAGRMIPMRALKVNPSGQIAPPDRNEAFNPSETENALKQG